jgi:hypothetical protein
VAREVKSQAGAGLFQAGSALGNGNGSHENGGRRGEREPLHPRLNDDRPRTAQDARAAFDSLFKK